MSDERLELSPAGPERLDEVEELLRANDLPAADVREKPECFYVAFDGEEGVGVAGEAVGVAGEAVGVGGVEVHGSVGLLRSVVVRDAVRGEGYGETLCEELEREAREAGVEDLFLLTTTAAGFFEGRGYERVDRDDAPDVLQGTAEFADLCPASATCMRKSLAR